MANTNYEIVEALRGILAERGIINDHSDWSKRLILFYAMKARSAILKAKLGDRKSSVSHFNKQTISCVPMLKLDINECPCAPPSGCHFYRSKYPIPAPIGRYLEIDTILGNRDIDYVEWGDFRNKLNSRFEADRNDSYWTLRNLGDGTYLYLYNYTEKFATVTSIFENPIDVFLFPDCEGNVNKCAQHLDFPFVLDDGYVALVLEAAYKMLAEKVKTDDVVLNQKDDTSATQTPIK